MKNWYASLILLVAYIGIFRFWAMVHPIQLTYGIAGTVVAVAMMAVMWWAGQKRYFVGITDYLIHSLVILDIFLEGVINPHHGTRDGWWCAVEFAVVIGLYRAFKLWRRKHNRDCSQTCHRVDALS